MVSSISDNCQSPSKVLPLLLCKRASSEEAASKIWLSKFTMVRTTAVFSDSGHVYLAYALVPDGPPPGDVRLLMNAYATSSVDSHAVLTL